MISVGLSKVVCSSQDKARRETGAKTFFSTGGAAWMLRGAQAQLQESFLRLLDHHLSQEEDGALACAGRLPGFTTVTAKKSRKALLDIFERYVEGVWHHLTLFWCV